MVSQPNVLEKLFEVEAASIQQTGVLQVFGARWPAGNGLDYATLDEALRDKIVDVTKISEGDRCRPLGSQTSRIARCSLWLENCWWVANRTVCSTPV